MSDSVVTNKCVWEYILNLLASVGFKAFPSVRPGMNDEKERCDCDCLKGQACRACRTDLVVLLVQLGVPLRTASHFVQFEVGTVEVSA